MRIFGDAPDSPFDRLATEPALLYGNNDILTEEPHEVGSTWTYSFWGDRREASRLIANKLYLHIPTNAWTRFTGLVREYLLPWRWKSVYLQREEGGSLDRVLVYQDDQVMSEECKRILGLPLFDTHLINISFCNESLFSYDEGLLFEFIKFNTQEAHHSYEIYHPFNFGSLIGGGARYPSPIYRCRNLFTHIPYTLLKDFSSSWKEVTMQVAGVSEKLLIRTADEHLFRDAGLILGD